MAVVWLSILQAQRLLALQVDKSERLQTLSGIV